MFTVFSIPKPFTGHTGVIQRNAVESWARLVPPSSILLFGDEPGTREVCAELGLTHVPAVKRSPLGTPLLSSAFAEAARRATTRLLCYANTDIIFLPDLPDVVARIPLPSYLLVGRRVNCDVTQPIDFTDAGWSGKLAALARDAGELAPANGIDYMLFPKDSPLTILPPFAVGRPAWDMWFLERAHYFRIPVVDGTASITAVHQNHGYGHVPRGRGVAWEGPEADENRRLAGWTESNMWERLYSIDDAHFILSGGEVVYKEVVSKVRPPKATLHLRALNHILVRLRKVSLVRNSWYLVRDNLLRRRKGAPAEPDRDVGVGRRAA